MHCCPPPPVYFILCNFVHFSFMQSITLFTFGKCLPIQFSDMIRIWFFVFVKYPLFLCTYKTLKWITHCMQCTVEVRWGIANSLFFLFLRAVVNIPIQTPMKINSWWTQWQSDYTCLSQCTENNKINKHYHSKMAALSQLQVFVYNTQ